MFILLDAMFEARYRVEEEMRNEALLEEQVMVGIAVALTECR